jgi:hypothetical protein
MTRFGIAGATRIGQFDGPFALHREARGAIPMPSEADALLLACPVDLREVGAAMPGRGWSDALQRWMASGVAGADPRRRLARPTSPVPVD